MICDELSEPDIPCVHCDHLISDAEAVKDTWEREISESYETKDAH